MSEIAPTDALACLADARAQLTRLLTDPRQPLHALLAAQLFEWATEDYARAASGERYHPGARNLGAVKEIISKKRGGGSFEDSFRGNTSPQKVLAEKLRNLDPYVTANGTQLQVVGPEHKNGNAVDLYITVREVVPGFLEPTSPVHGGDDDTQLERALAMIAAWFRERFRADPAKLGKFEKDARHRGVGYALAAFFGFVACTGWVAWQYRHLTDGSIRAAVVPGIPQDASPGMAAAVVWSDDHASSESTYLIFKDGQRVAEVTAKAAWRPEQQRYMWIDPHEMPLGQDHTYRLAKKFLRMKAIDVTQAMDLKPCWKCLMDAARQQLRDPAKSLPTRGEFDAVAGTPFRFGGRLDRKSAAADPHFVPPVTKVRVDFGDGQRPSLLDSNNIVHTYLRAGQYEMHVQPLDDRYITPAPIHIRVAPADLRSRPGVRAVFLTRPTKKGDIPVIPAALAGQSAVIPLDHWLSQVNNDLGGDYLENVRIGISYGDASQVEVTTARDVMSVAGARTRLVGHVQHAWPARAGDRYEMEVFGYSQEHGTRYFTVTPVIVLNRFPFRLYPGLIGGMQPAPAMWFLDLPEREKYASGQVGVTWSASLDPWLNAIRDDLGELPKNMELYVDYGDHVIKRAPSLSLGPIHWGHAGQSWVQFILKDPARNVVYVGETKVDIR
jgi:hypothetical protein